MTRRVDPETLERQIQNAMTKLKLSRSNAEEIAKLSFLEEGESDELMAKATAMASDDDDCIFGGVSTYFYKLVDERLGIVGKKRGERGLAKATLEFIEICREVLEPIQPHTVRGVAYQLFNVRGVIPSMEEKHTKRVSEKLTTARERGMIPWEWIVDDSREIETTNAWRDPAQFAKTIINSYRKDFWLFQPYRIIIVSEKSTVGGILRPVKDEWGVDFLPVHGWSSATMMRQLAMESANDERETVCIYCGDYDCSGCKMSECDFPGRIKEYGGRVTVRRVALLKDDIAGMPWFPATDKKKDPNYKWWIASGYGDRCVELDAMNPNLLRDRVSEVIAEYVDPVKWERHKLAERAEVETIKQVVARMKKVA